MAELSDHDLDWITNDDGVPLYSVPVANDVAVYETEDGHFLCAECARGENGSDAHIDHDDPQWNIVAAHPLTNVNPWPDDHPDHGSDNLPCSHCYGSLNHHNH
jgi:hypothetical protein